MRLYIHGGSVTQEFTFNNIEHNADGTKSVSWEWSCDTGTSVLGNIYRSGTQTLTTIPRASQPTLSANSVNLGSSVTINTNRASSSFTHTLSYSIGSLSNQTSGLAASSGVTTSTTFTPPASLANQFPNATQGTVKISCKTYNGSTLIGTKTVNLTVKTINNSTYQPTISLSATASSQFNSKYLNKVSGVTVSATTTQKYGATRNSYSISGAGKSSSNANLVVSPLNVTMSAATQTVTFTGTTTDSRGYTGTGTTSITLYRYNAPQITAYAVQRCTSDGTISNSGTYVKATLTYTYQNDGYSNSMSVHKININNTDTTITTTETTSNGVVTGTGSVVTGGGYIAINTHYPFTITCTDAVGKTITVNGTVQTSSRIINVRPRRTWIKLWQICRDG